MGHGFLGCTLQWASCEQLRSLLLASVIASWQVCAILNSPRITRHHKQQCIQIGFLYTDASRLVQCQGVTAALAGDAAFKLEHGKTVSFDRTQSAVVVLMQSG